MKFVKDLPFSNWGGNIKNTPRYTFVARTVVGVENLVKWAKEKNYKVRSAGYTHTWSNSYSETGQVLVTLLPLSEASTYPSPEPPMNSKYLQSIEVVKDLGDHAHVRIGAGTTNYQFRAWAFEQKKWTLPMNTILVEVTFGGTNAPICHGAGIKNTTLSDLVVALEYVDSNGVSQTLTDPAELKAASGCFGLLGIVTAVTLQVDKMSAAVLQPSKPRIPLAVPPPPDYPIPAGVDMKGITPEELKNAQAEFEANCKKDYGEFFWFPYNRRGWVNCWNQSPDPPMNVQTFPAPLDAFIQWIGAWFLRLLTEYPIFKILPGKVQGWFLGWLAMFQLQGGDSASSIAPIIALKSDAMHFQRGVHNFAPVNDMEWEIPIPEKADGTLDFSVVQRAWWDAISATYADPSGALRVALEMRITGGSDTVMSPQRRNKATCSIEILTLANTSADVWRPYAQTVLDHWSSLVDFKGAQLPIRPHWAKMWQGYKVRGVAVERYLKQVAYRDDIPEFKQVLSGIATRTGGSLDDCRARFSNSLYDQILFS
ncbi:hypothetical protein M407DRAFT_216008 [Tulasnella calospora MUT 4182]|uniref:FAD-binding PCMH-type domain-containing protein n=1 Tax=Tulasnella calospora MUT 4182 TaxID=1051891 RepID=A0A0C3QBY9_9AGAM|nr:hypothetical protein M407DRAFT_216008 [Tulasnella calospora MUT 4182]